MERGGRQGSVVDESRLNVTSVLTKSHEHAIVNDQASLDEQMLGALGYKQEFKRYPIQRRNPRTENLTS